MYSVSLSLSLPPSLSLSLSLCPECTACLLLLTCLAKARDKWYFPCPGAQNLPPPPRQISKTRCWCHIPGVLNVFNGLVAFVVRGTPRSPSSALSHPFWGTAPLPKWTTENSWYPYSNLSTGGTGPCLGNTHSGNERSDQTGHTLRMDEHSGHVWFVNVTLSKYPWNGDNEVPAPSMISRMRGHGCFLQASPEMVGVLCI